MKYKYEYRKVNIPKEIADESKTMMHQIGCRTLTTFSAIALKELNGRLKLEKAQQEASAKGES